MKSSTESSSTISDKDNAHCETEKQRDVTNGDVISHSHDVARNGDEVKARKDDSLNTETKYVNLNEDISSQNVTNERDDVTLVNDDVRKEVDDVIGVVEDKVNERDEKGNDNSLGKGANEKMGLNVNQDLRRMKTTLAFLDEDVRDVLGCEEGWDLNNYKSEEENSELEENDIDDDDNDDICHYNDNIDNDIDECEVINGDDIGENIGDGNYDHNIDVDYIHDDNDHIDDNGHIDVEDEVDGNNGKTARYITARIPSKKKKSSKGLWMSFHGLSRLW